MLATMVTKEEILNFQKTILDYYKENGRKFSWRETDNPYEIYISEIMLQQTQTDRVEKKYSEWLSVFPSVASVAKSSLGKVLEYWNGLGYNRRAVHIFETCKIITKDYGGIFPTDRDVLISLPGIGEYTSGAISTFSTNKPQIFIETNIRSVFIFFFFNEILQSQSRKIHDNEIFPLIEKTLYVENPRMWYYALMDYGALLKAKTKNPSRQSAHYAKQSVFKGSNRQARGAIIRALTKKNICALDEIEKEEKISYDLLVKAAESLLAEGLIVKEDDSFKILE
ncbi:MAG: A/G-specific adenine glycosylase [Spirochaetaceae bacterium]|nr:A/G-specific adenine glycosylase [Spirochaetaceae bacterium]